MGVVFVVLAAYLLKAKKFVLRQFAIVSGFMGQIAVIFHTVDLINQIIPILFFTIGDASTAYFI